MTINTIEGNTSSSKGVMANGGSVARKSYSHTYNRIAMIIRPKYRDGEACKIVKEALKWEGYLEKKSNNQLDDFTANAGYNNYNIFAKHGYDATKSGVFVNGVYWCDIFKSDIFIRALGVSRAKELLYDWSVYCPTSSAWMRKAGGCIVSKDKAQFGDVIYFYDSKGNIGHVGIVTNGYVENSLSYKGHVQGIGWMTEVSDGDICGTTGQSKRLEAIVINGSAKFRYQVHCEGYGDMPIKTNGQITGTTGESKRIEAIKIDCDKKIKYSVHIQGKGWSKWYTNGKWAGTKGKSLRIEAIRIKYV